MRIKILKKLNFIMQKLKLFRTDKKLNFLVIKKMLAFYHKYLRGIK